MIKKTIYLSLFLAIQFLFAQKSIHKVQQGETLYNISKRYGLTLNELLEMNPQIVDGKIKIGDQLNVKNKVENSITQTHSEHKFVSAKEDNSSETDYIIVKPKQTLYGIIKQYKVSEEIIRKLNPSLEMKIGEKIILPLQNVKKYADKDAKNNSLIPSASNTSKETKILIPNTKNQNKNPKEDYQYYSVSQGDTTFGIINQYNISLEELIAQNPEVKEGLKPNMVLKLKKKIENYKKNSSGPLNVLFLLPFGFDDNETKYRSMSTEFFSGAKIAIEKNVKLGQKLNINVIDTGTEASFKKKLSQLNTENIDLIIGPFFKSNLIEVLNYTQESKIPVVSPFANSPELYKYSNLIIVETNELVFADRIVNEIKSDFNDQKIYIVSNQNENIKSYLESELKKKLSNPNIKIVSSPSEIIIETNPMTGLRIPIIAVLAEDNDKIAAEFSAKIIEISKQIQGFKAYSMYFSNVFDKKINELANANLVYIIDRKVNMEGDFEQEILQEFNNKYCKSPSKYAMIGFDVVNDMLTRENSYGEIFNQIYKPQTQLATKFEFKRTPNEGAFINIGHRIVRLKPAL